MNDEMQETLKRVGKMSELLKFDSSALAALVIALLVEKHGMGTELNDALDKATEGLKALEKEREEVFERARSTSEDIRETP